MDKLVPELRLRIVHFLNRESLGRIAQVSKDWKGVATPHLYHRFYKRALRYTVLGGDSDQHVAARILAKLWSYAREEVLAPPPTISVPHVETTTVLHAAAAAGRLEVVRTFVNWGGDVDLLDGFGYTPLWCAVMGGQAHVVKFLLNRGADRNVTDEKGCPLLFAAAEYGDPTTVGTLIVEARADINIVDTGGRTPLSYAAHRGCTAVVGLLIEYGGRFKDPDSNGMTPMCYALDAGHLDVVCLLGRCGAEIKAEMAERMFYPRRADVDWVDYKCGAIKRILTSRFPAICTPEVLAAIRARHDLRVAARMGYPTESTIALDDEEFVEDHPICLLCTAAQFGDAEVVRECLDRGDEIEHFDPTTRDRLPLSPLCLAITAGHLSVVRWLVYRSAPARSEELRCAVVSGYRDITTFLIQEGVWIKEAHVREALLADNPAIVRLICTATASWLEQQVPADAFRTAESSRAKWWVRWAEWVMKSED